MARMDAIELLEHDHRMVEQLFRDYHSAASDAQRRGVVELTVRELSKHAALEETMVYPLVRRALPDEAEMIDRRLAGQMAVKKTLVALDKLSADDDRTGELMAQLQDEVEAHVRDDEGDTLPKLRGAVDQQTLDELGDTLDQAKHSAPTRPHPHSPDRPPMLTMAAPVAAIYDRFRDRLQGRPRT